MLYKSPYASQVRGFLQDLDFEVLKSIASTASDRKIVVTTKEEAIVVILIHTSDLERFFTYWRLTSDIFSKYLHTLQMKNKKIKIPMKTSRTEMIFTIKDFWEKHVAEAQRALEEKHVAEAQRALEKIKPPVIERAPPMNVTNIIHNISVGVPSTSNFQFTIDTSLPSTSSNSVRSDKFAKDFCEWFYKMMNKLQPICAHKEGDVFSERVFVGNSSVLILMTTNEVVQRMGTNQIGAYLVLKNTLIEFELLFSPNIESGLQLLRGEHGSVKVLCCGNLHKHNAYIGIYEQEFDLVFCPVDELWKILRTKLNLKHAAVAPQMPSLPPCEIFEIKT